MKWRLSGTTPSDCMWALFIRSAQSRSKDLLWHVDSASTLGWLFSGRPIASIVWRADMETVPDGSPVRVDFLSMTIRKVEMKITERQYAVSHRYFGSVGCCWGVVAAPMNINSVGR